MVVNHGMPEEFRERFACLILCQFIVTRFGYDFRDKRIRMFPKSYKNYLLHVPFVLRIIALILIILVLARPQTTDSWQMD